METSGLQLQIYLLGARNHFVEWLANMFLVLVVVGVYALPQCLSSNIYQLNERDFEGYIQDKDIMLVDFFAPWCPHCQELSPELEAAANLLATKNQYVFAKVDCMGDGKQLCERFNVQGYPTLKLFKYGHYVGDYVGQRDKSSLMRYVDSVASTYAQHAPLTTTGSKPETLAQAIESRPQVQAFPSPQTSSINAPQPAIAPTYISQMHTQLNNPSLLGSFYGSSAQHAPVNMAAYANQNPSIHQASPDSLQSKFGNMLSLEVYRSKLKMIAAYKNYQRRLKEYREKLTAANKANVNRNPATYAGAVTQPPRPGTNPLFSQSQSYHEYYRPEAIAAQNVQLNRAAPQTGSYGTSTDAPPYQYAEPYGNGAPYNNPYYRSKLGNRKGKGNAKQQTPNAATDPALTRQAEVIKERKAAAQYNAKLLKERERLQQQREQQEKKQQQQRQQKQRQQKQQQHQQEPGYPQQQKKQQQQQENELQPQIFRPTPQSPGNLSDSTKTPDPSALKDLKADIESAIQDALKNAARESNKAKPIPAAQIDGGKVSLKSSKAGTDYAVRDDGSGAGPVDGSGSGA